MCMHATVTHHAASHHNALATSRTSTGARCNSHPTRMLTSLPGLTSRSRATPAQAHVAKANEIRVWACEMGNGPNPTPRAHARIAKPLTQPAPADRRHRANGGAPWFSLFSSRRFHMEVVFPVTISFLRRITNMLIEISKLSYAMWASAVGDRSTQ